MIYIQNPGNIVSDMDGEKVMMNIENGKYYNLGSIGGIIWEKLKTPKTIQQITLELITEFEVEQAECAQQVTSFLSHLYEEGLIGSIDGKENEAYE